MVHVAANKQQSSAIHSCFFFSAENTRFFSFTFSFSFFSFSFFSFSFSLFSFLLFCCTMVYMSGGKMARHQAAIVNLPTCGGNKKAGTAARVGWFLPSNVYLRGAPQRMPLVCVPNHSRPTQVTGYRATHTGRMG